jgi:integrase/recombinase XerD
MQRLGYDAFLPTEVDVAKNIKTFTPYIFTHDEIRRFFAVLNTLKHEKFSTSHRYHIVMPVLFKILYCCGLRISEALNLQGHDVNLNDGILAIRDSKNEKSRYVQMSPELTSVLADYDSTRYRNTIDGEWFFPSRDGGIYEHSSVYKCFRQTLHDAGISYGGRGNGPRMHDLRHTFAVHCLQKWVDSDKDLTAMLPRLSAYLGHSTMRYTEPYLRMTGEVYSQISAQTEELYSFVIPPEVADL